MTDTPPTATPDDLARGDGPMTPPSPGDADESRVAILRATWTAIVPRGPVEHQTGWQIAKPDVLFLLDLAEECLRRRREEAPR